MHVHVVNHVDLQRLRSSIKSTQAVSVTEIAVVTSEAMTAAGIYLQ